jgi:SH3 domain-containing YSC84-like protein 1
VLLAPFYTFAVRAPGARPERFHHPCFGAFFGALWPASCSHNAWRHIAKETYVKLRNQSIAAAVLAAASTFGASNQEPEAAKRVHEATAVFKEIMDAKDAGIPQDLLDHAHCAVIVPGMKHGAFIVGAKYGKGVLMCRKAGGGWAGPATVRIEGGSFGLQAGGGETDLILLVMNERGAQKLLKSEFKIGGEAGVMAGPVGRTVQAETDAFMRAEMLGYSRSRGVFAGVALEGSTLREDLNDNRALYGSRVSNEEIMNGAVSVSRNSGAGELARTLDRYSSWEKK